jgi:hypothetical protein
MQADISIRIPGYPQAIQEYDRHFSTRHRHTVMSQEYRSSNDGFKEEGSQLLATLIELIWIEMLTPQYSSLKWNFPTNGKNIPSTVRDSSCLKDLWRFTLLRGLIDT